MSSTHTSCAVTRLGVRARSADLLPSNLLPVPSPVLIERLLLPDHRNFEHTSVGLGSHGRFSCVRNASEEQQGSILLSRHAMPSADLGDDSSRLALTVSSDAILLLVLVFSLVPNSHLSGCDQHGDVEGHADGTFYMQNLELCRELQADVTSGVIDAEIVMSASGQREVSGTDLAYGASADVLISCVHSEVTPAYAFAMRSPVPPQLSPPSPLSDYAFVPY
eukprot:3937404-Rhodomonas_salina.3